MRLIATGDYDVWLITWPPGSGIGVHDHTESISVIRVVSGEIVETVAGTFRTARPSDLIVTSAHMAHELKNVGFEEATTLHVYSPPLTAVTYRSGELEDLSVAINESGFPAPTPVRARQAEASAGVRYVLSSSRGENRAMQNSRPLFEGQAPPPYRWPAAGTRTPPLPEPAADLALPGPSPESRPV